jgi:hypothetical protein
VASHADSEVDRRAPALARGPQNLQILLDQTRLTAGKHKRSLLRLIDRARSALRLRSVLRIIRLSPSRYHHWNRQQQCAFDDQPTCPRLGMNPDGTSQRALYGSNSWFPTAFRFARPVPDHPTRLVGIISGHHDYGDCGRLAILDPGLAGAYPFRYRPASKEWGQEGKPIAVTPEVLPAEQTGFLQLVPGRGKKVAGTVCDAILTHHYLKESPALATHPHPLSSKYFLVSMKPRPQSLWGIYLVDVFDNATLIAEFPEAALFEPQPLVPRPRPPVIPDRIVPESKTAEVHIADIYSGPGLKGVPRGTVKRLRVFAYHFGYLNKAGFDIVGTEGGWDVKRILGTAKVEEDGSACFQIPANTPVSLQPLDNEGRAVQLMRSWLVGIPGQDPAVVNHGVSSLERHLYCDPRLCPSVMVSGPNTIAGAVRELWLSPDNYFFDFFGIWGLAVAADAGWGRTGSG